MTTVRTRREPPLFRRVDVARVVPRTASLLRITLTGAELAGLDSGLPAASVRLLVPPDDGGQLVLPVWNGNEFLAADGSRPPIRTLTPVRFDPQALELDVEVVLHGDGPLSSWAGRVEPGARTAISGPGRGYTVDPEAREYLVAGDESALPAIGVLLAALPTEAAVQVIVEISDPSARLDLPPRRGVVEQWLLRPAGAPPGDALVAAVAAAEVGSDVRVWAAGEAAAMWRIRRDLFEERGLARSRAVVRGYWKVGRGGDADDT